LKHLTQLLLSLVLILILTPSALADDWPVANGDVRNSLSSSKTIVPPLEQRWWNSAYGAISPAVDGYNVYIRRNGSPVELVAVDLVSGQYKWDLRFNDQPLPGQGYYVNHPPISSPAVKNGIIYVCSRWHLYAIKDNGNNGEILWSVPVATNHPPIVTDSAVYIADFGYILRSFDPKTGEEFWKGQAPPWTNSTPTIGDGIIFTDCNQAINAYRNWGGRYTNLWTKNMGATEMGQIVYQNGMLYVSQGDMFYGISAATGNTIWQRRLPAKVTDSPALGINNVYINLVDSSTVDLDLKSGAQRWRAYGGTGGHPLVVGNVVYVSGIDSITGLDAYSGKNLGTGTINWPPVHKDKLFPVAVAKGFLLCRNKDYLFGFLPTDENIKIKLDKILTYDFYQLQQEIIFNRLPVNINGRVLVPMRKIFEILGATVKWDGTTNSVTAMKDGKVIKLTIDQNTVSVNGEKIVLDVAPRLIDDVTMVPVRFVTESFDMQVTWDGLNNTVNLSGYRDFPVQKLVIDGQEIPGGTPLRLMYNNRIMIDIQPLFPYIGGTFTKFMNEVTIEYGSDKVRIIPSAPEESRFNTKYVGTKPVNAWSPQEITNELWGSGHCYVDLGYFAEPYEWQTNWDRANKTLYITTK